MNIHTQIKYGLKKSKCKNEHNGIIKKIKLEWYVNPGCSLLCVWEQDSVQFPHATNSVTFNSF